MGNPSILGCACPTTSASGAWSATISDAGTGTVPILITAGETATVVVTFATWAAGPSVTGSYTFSAPVAPQGTLVASFSPDALWGVGSPPPWAAPSTST